MNATEYDNRAFQRGLPSFTTLIVRSRISQFMKETLEMPSETNLRSLRVFLLRNFPYFPRKFLFELSDGSKIDKHIEKTVLVTSLSETIYLHPYIPFGILHLIVHLIIYLLDYLFIYSFIHSQVNHRDKKIIENTINRILQMKSIKVHHLMHCAQLRM